MGPALCFRLRDPRIRRFLTFGGIWLLALLVRAVYLRQLQTTPLGTVLLGDAERYDAWAAQLAAGDWLGDSVFYQAPLYPYFLGVVYWCVGHSVWAARLVQAVVGASSCVVLAAATDRLFARRVGWIAGLMLALYPPAIFHDGMLQKTVLDTFLFCLLIWLVSRQAAESQDGHLGLNPAGWAAMGIVLGALSLTRENSLLLAPVMLAWIGLGFHERSRRMRAAWAACLMAGLAVTLLPVAVRNQIIGGEFHLTTSQFGPNFYIGNGADADGTYLSLRPWRGDARFERTDAELLAESDVGRELTPREVSRYWFAATIEEIQADPAQWLRLLAWKWFLVWNATEVADTEDQLAHAEYSPLFRAILPLWHWGWLCPLAVFGAAATWRERRGTLLLIVLSLVYAASVVVFYVFARYRFPLVLLAIPFAAVAFPQAVALLRRGRWQTVVVCLLVAVSTAVAVNQPTLPTGPMHAHTHHVIALRLTERGADFDDVVWHYRRAMQIDPQLADLHVHLGDYLLANGRTPPAMAEYQAALRLSAGIPGAHHGVGKVRMKEGRVEEALPHFQTALDLQPDHDAAHYWLAAALMEQSDRAARGRGRFLLQGPGGRMWRDEAVAHLREAIRLQPAFPPSRIRLAQLLLRQNRNAEALTHLKVALQNTRQPSAPAEGLQRMIDAVEARLVVADGRADP